MLENLGEISENQSKKKSLGVEYKPGELGDSYTRRVRQTEADDQASAANLLAGLDSEESTFMGNLEAGSKKENEDEEVADGRGEAMGELTRAQYDNLCWKESLTINEAKQIVNYVNKNGESVLSLGLTSIDKDMVVELRKMPKLEMFSLDGLTSIDKDTVIELRKMQNLKALFLWGLTSMTDDVAQELAKIPEIISGYKLKLTPAQKQILQGHII